MVGATHRPVQQLVAHGPSVDEEILLLRVAAIESRQPDVAAEPGHRVALGLDTQSVVGEFADHDRVEALQTGVEQVARCRR